MGNPIPRQRNVMSQSTYQSVVLAQRPKSLIVPGETFTLKTNPMLLEKDLKDDEVLVETLYLSLDPAMRGCKYISVPEFSKSGYLASFMLALERLMDYDTFHHPRNFLLRHLLTLKFT
jgi:NADPH-dependent curcumin reductase CurA